MERYGKETKINQELMNTIASYMDDDKRETVHAELAPCEPEEFLKRYLELDPNFEEILNNEFDIEISREKYHSEFDRCWFGISPEPTLLNHLLCWGYDPEDYLNTLDDIETAIKEKEYLAEHPEEADEESQYIDDDIESWQEELKDMRADWKPEKEPNMDEEIEIIKKWVKERKLLKIVQTY